MPHVSANNIDRTLIIVSMSMFSGSRNPNMAIILVCGGCRSSISANKINRKLILVSMSLFSGSRNPNMAIMLVCGGCRSHFQNG